MKILVLTSRFPYPLEKGDKLRIYHQMRRMAAAGHDLSLITFAELPVQNSDFQRVKIFCKTIHVFRLAKFSAFQNLLSNILRGCALPFQIAYFDNSRIRKQVAAIIEQEKPDHIYCHLVRMSAYVRDLAIPKTLDFMDAFGAGTERRAAISSSLLRPFWRWEARKMLAYEKSIRQDFDQTVIISEQDSLRLPIAANLSAANTKPTIVIPNGVDTDFFSLKNTPSVKQPQIFDLAFIGNLGYYSNVEAARFLVKNILPLLHQMPDLTVQLVGARPTAEMQSWANERVKVFGWQEDIRTAYSRSKILVAPLMHGIGQQNKILEAMAMGVPVITTSRVNNAIGAAIDREILVADTEEVFAEQIQRLLQDIDLQKLIAKNSRIFVEKNYSWTEMTTRLLAVFATTKLEKIKPEYL